MKKSNGNYTLKQKFNYWFDRQMAKGTSKMIMILTISTIVTVLLIALIIFAFNFNEGGGFPAAVWDIFATTINAWMPYSDEGGIGYIILTALSAIIGVLFTSFLIGIVSTAITEKLEHMRKGNSPVLESNHIVVLGFEPGEYTIINELIKAANGEKKCIVVAENMENDEMTDLISMNVDIPSNINLICRKADITDPVSLECCAIPDCEIVVVSYGNDSKTLKAVLAVGLALGKANAKDKGIYVVSAVCEEKYRLPKQLRRRNHILMIQTKDLISRIIAHSCTQPGISFVVRDIFNFDGSEFYASDLKECEGKSFSYLIGHIKGGIPVGILTDDSCILNPPADRCIQHGEKLIYYAEEKNKIKLDSSASVNSKEFNSCADNHSGEEDNISLLVIGFNDMFDTFISELPPLIKHVTVATLTEKQQYDIRGYSINDERLSVTDVLQGTVLTASDNNLETLIKDYNHVVVLSDHDADPEDADMETTLCLIRLKDIKKRLGLQFSITAEMISEKNRDLIKNDDLTDFVLASDFVAMALAQMTVSPELYSLFKEILTNRGNELWVKPAGPLGIPNAEISVSELRHYLYNKKQSILMGYIINGKKGKQTILNPPADSKIRLSYDDSVIVMCDN